MAPPSKHIPEYLSHKDESACTYRKNLNVDILRDFIDKNLNRIEQRLF